MTEKVKVNKPIILEIDNVRIRKWDEQNYYVEREETYFNPKEKKYITDYRFKGYYSTVLGALESIHLKGLLIDNGGVGDLTDVLKQVMESEKREVDAMSRLDVKEGRGKWEGYLIIVCWDE